MKYLKIMLAVCHTLLVIAVGISSVCYYDFLIPGVFVLVVLNIIQYSLDQRKELLIALLRQQIERYEKSS